MTLNSLIHLQLNVRIFSLLVETAELEKDKTMKVLETLSTSLTQQYKLNANIGVVLA